MDKKMKAVADYLRSHDFKLTNQRLKIVQTIFETRDHFTADDLYDVLRGKGENVSKATVYRTLSILAEGGIIDAQDFGQGPLYYEPALGAKDHYHLICTETSKVIEFRNAEVDEILHKIAKARGFQVKSISVRIFGTSKAARKKSTAAVSGNGQ
jgi:Fur family ferric uptake transcriptional regulator